MTRGIIVQNCVWHLQIFYASNHLRSIFVFLLRSSMSLIDLSTAGGLKWSSLFQKHNLKLVKHEFQLSSVQLKLLKFPLWTCTAERDRERIWRSRLRERQPGGYWIWLKDCKRNIAHPVKIRQRILLPDGSNYEKELKKIIFKLWPPSQHKLCSTTPDVVLKYVAIFFSSAFFKSESESNS